MESFKAFLVSLASGSSFIIGTGLMFVGGVLPSLGGLAMYFMGYELMHKYKKMD